MVWEHRDKYCVVGVGETEYSKNSRTHHSGNGGGSRPAQPWTTPVWAPTRWMGCSATTEENSTTSTTIMYDLGLRLNFFMDCSGGGSSTEALIGIAVGAIEAGMCGHSGHIFRSMNGYSQVRIGGTGVRQAAPCIRRRPGQADLRPSKRCPELRIHLYPAHDGVRHPERAPGGHQGGPQQPCFQ